MRILHVFRTPVGGLFRHVRDLARGQAERGHDVGILCDSMTGGEAATALLQQAKVHCALGITRIAISRLPGWGDVIGTRQTIAHAKAMRPDIIHCHGAKGGVYGRLAARALAIPAIYTPHGGSLHYRWSRPSGLVFLGAEWLLARLGCGFHFVCAFEKQEFARKIGIGTNPARVIYNGLWPEELELAKPFQDASDILFIGELRDIKGVDLLIDALAKVNASRKVTATLVGDGPDGDRYRALVRDQGLDGVITFAGRLPARDAFRRGGVLIMPSRNESFPYVVLEAMAAGVPIYASNVGGIAEALPQQSLFPPQDTDAIARCIDNALANSPALVTLAMANREAVRTTFSASRMVESALAFYGELCRS
jgi:glycosyltransferase involved in cell wall biosynthesis